MQTYSDLLGARRCCNSATPNVIVNNTTNNVVDTVNVNPERTYVSSGVSTLALEPTTGVEKEQDEDILNLTKLFYTRYSLSSPLIPSTVLIPKLYFNGHGGVKVQALQISESPGPAANYTITGVADILPDSTRPIYDYYVRIIRGDDQQDGGNYFIPRYNTMGTSFPQDYCICGYTLGTQQGFFQQNEIANPNIILRSNYIIEIIRVLPPTSSSSYSNRDSFAMTTTYRFFQNVALKTMLDEIVANVPAINASIIDTDAASMQVVEQQNGFYLGAIDSTNNHFRTVSFDNMGRIVAFNSPDAVLTGHVLHSFGTTFQPKL